VQIQLVLCATASPILFGHVAALFVFSDVAEHFMIHDDFSDQVTGIIDVLAHLGDQWLRELLLRQLPKYQRIREVNHSVVPILSTLLQQPFHGQVHGARGFLKPILPLIAVYY
jgi:hypothetical protein